MSECRGGFVIRRGNMFHGRRSGTLIGALEEAKIWRDRLDAQEQAGALNAKDDPSLPLWTVEAVQGNGARA